MQLRGRDSFLIELMLIALVGLTLGHAACGDSINKRATALTLEAITNGHQIQLAIERYATDRRMYPPFLYGGDVFSTFTTDRSTLDPAVEGAGLEIDLSGYTGDQRAVRGDNDCLLQYGYLDSYPRNPFIQTLEKDDRRLVTNQLDCTPNKQPFERIFTASSPRAGFISLENQNGWRGALPRVPAGLDNARMWDVSEGQRHGPFMVLAPGERAGGAYAPPDEYDVAVHAADHDDAGAKGVYVNETDGYRQHPYLPGNFYYYPVVESPCNWNLAGYSQMPQLAGYRLAIYGAPDDPGADVYDMFGDFNDRMISEYVDELNVPEIDVPNLGGPDGRADGVAATLTSSSFVVWKGYGRWNQGDFAWSDRFLSDGRYWGNRHLLAQAYYPVKYDHAPDSKSPQTLERAVWKGSAWQVKSLLKSGWDVNQPGASGMAPLFTALRAGRPEMLRLLLKNRAEFNGARTVNEALTIAATQGGAQMLETLMDEICSKREFSEDDLNSLIRLASVSGDIETVRLLIERGADPLKFEKHLDCFRIAIANGNEDVAMYLLNLGASISNPDDKGDRQDAIHFAAREGMLEVARGLLDKGADPNQPAGKNTPLSCLGGKNAFEMAKLLIERGANIAPGEGLDIPFVVCCRKFDRPDVLGLLDPDWGTNYGSDNWGRSPLGVSAAAGHPGNVRYLLEKGFAVDEANSKSGAPLHYAANPETARVLIEFGADLDAQTQGGSTALMSHLHFHRLDVARVLVEAGADLNIVNGSGESALSIAESRRMYEFAEWLKEQGARPANGSRQK